MPLSTRSLLFDGSSGYVAFGSSFPSLSGVMSLSYWVKYNTVSIGNYLIWDAVGGQASIRANSGNNLDFYQGSSAASFFGGGSGSAGVSSGVWYHNFWLRTGSSGSWTIKLWVNGNLDANSPQTITADPAASPTGYRFGESQDIGQYLNGLLDDVAVWTSDQSANVSGLAAGTTDPATLSPVGLWRFEEGTGTTAGDSGSGGHAGTLTGGVTWSTDVPSQLAGGGATPGGHYYRRLLAGGGF